jgi:hypothetical protein
MSIATVTYYLAIPITQLHLPEKFIDVRWAAIDEFSDLAHGGKLPLSDIGASIVVAKLVEGKRPLAAAKKMLGPRIMGHSAVIQLDIELDLCKLMDFLRQGAPPSSDEAKFVYLLARSVLAKRISDLLIVSNLARVGALALSQSAIILDGKFDAYDRIQPVDTSTLINVSQPKDDGNASLQTLSLDMAAVFEWYSGHMDILDGFTSNPLHRAFCAFSRTFDERIQSSPEQLMWTVLALEAIFIKGKVGMTDQLKEKAIALLGDLGSIKIQKFYDIRSRFVHGDMDFPPHEFDSFAKPEFEKYEVNTRNALIGSQTVLVRTFQEIIIRGWSGLRFETTPSDVI